MRTLKTFWMGRQLFDVGQSWPDTLPAVCCGLNIVFPSRKLLIISNSLTAILRVSKLHGNEALAFR
jgi:hypothetical protein